ncbi:DMT family transporter [Tabrizicola sp. J26]|uniref:DMT family transporter n=1 Tax=Alitabrizicola rongguiensis TaxID=2909234 RepID=UPI001F3B31C9|nr:DMT family transporter [Tabrizicola rongguiensis]MCF1710365.1 DMT family transporter [Tabrizicola rongguiensis]
MRALAARNPQAYGLLITGLGVLVFVPDVLVLRLVGGDLIAVAVFRGLLAGTVSLAALWLIGGRFPSFAVLATLPGAIVVLMQGFGLVAFCAAVQGTSAANALLMTATAPFIAAVLSWALLGERIGRTTLVAIALAFAGVLVVAAGGLGGGRLWGDLMALANALALACFYVALRKAGRQDMFPALIAGYFLGAALAVPLADFSPMEGRQILWLIVSGAVILPLAVGLLSLGPRYLTAPEVSMMTLLEIILGPLLVWAVIGEDPGRASLVGGAMIVAAVLGHALWALRSPEAEAA